MGGWEIGLVGMSEWVVKVKVRVSSVSKNICGHWDG